MRFPFAREGWIFVLPAAALVALAAWSGWWFAAGILFVVLAILVNFFRDPERQLPTDSNALVSPADGKVISIIDVPAETSPLGRASRRASIFMNPFNVHVNRAPSDGAITAVKYQPGKKMAAFDERASAENERNLVVMATPRGPLAFTQIAGFLARRIVFYKPAGAALVRGERVGLIKFSSRVDVFLPVEVPFTLTLGEKVRAGESVIARWPEGTDVV